MASRIEGIEKLLVRKENMLTIFKIIQWKPYEQQDNCW